MPHTAAVVGRKARIFRNVPVIVFPGEGVDLGAKPGETTASRPRHACTAPPAGIRLWADPAIRMCSEVPMPTRHGLIAQLPAVPHRLSRRSFLRIGALGLGGLTLPGLLRAEAAAGIRSSHKSVILIYLVGGPPHQDLFDLTPGAPREIAGPCTPTATSAPGV